MPRKKLERFAQLHSLENVFEYDRDEIAKKLKKIIKNKKVILELACGRGEYSLGLATDDNKTIFIGFDVQGERLWFGATQALEKKQKNVFFVRAPIEKLSEYFPPKSIAEIWIVFPDPFPKDKHEARRLTSSFFLQQYHQLLKNKGLLHLKTDSLPLFQYSQKVLTNNNFILLKKLSKIIINKTDSPLNIQTAFEIKHRRAGKTIKYLLSQKK